MLSHNGFTQEVAGWKQRILSYLTQCYKLNAQSYHALIAGTVNIQKNLSTFIPNLGSGNNLRSVRIESGLLKEKRVQNLHKVFNEIVPEILK